MQQQDQQLINSLLEQQNSSAYVQQSAQDSSESQISISRVVTAKYKVYVIILLILSVILGTKFLPRAWSDFQKSQENFEQKQTKIQQLDTQIQEYKTKKTVWKAITSTKEQIIGCVNDATNQHCVLSWGWLLLTCNLEIWMRQKCKLMKRRSWEI